MSKDSQAIASKARQNNKSSALPLSEKQPLSSSAESENGPADSVSSNTVVSAMSAPLIGGQGTGRKITVSKPVTVERALARRGASRRLEFSLPEDQGDVEPESNDAWVVKSPLDNSYGSGSDTGSCETSISEDQNVSDQHRISKPVLRRSRALKSLPPLFQEAWNALEELEEHEANTTDEKMMKAKAKVALRRRQRRMNLVVDKKTLISTLNYNQTPPKDSNRKLSIVPVTYKGPKLPENDQMSMEFVLQLINATRSGIKLHYLYAWKIISAVSSYFQKYESTVVDIRLPDNGTMVIVGDLHGQLDDLLTIFRIREFPSPNNFYLFNGDLVDRGDYSIEVLLIVYSLKLLFPEAVFINRGNHEHRLMNARYNFELQVKQLYDAEMYELIQTSFNWLPIATVVEESVFVVHGGLTQYEDFTIDELRTISRRDLLPHPLVNTREDRILEQLLWSDPGKGGKSWMQNRRGAGILYSAEITRAFLKANNIKIVIRSHQMVDTGYARVHDGAMITIFSASHYCDHNDNLGAIAVMEAQTGKLQFIQFEADKNLLAYAPNLSKSNIDPKMVEANHQRVANQQRDETLQKLHERILSKRHSLYLAFAQLDRKTGYVSINDWASVMTQVIRIDLHWVALWPFLGYRDKQKSASKDRNSKKDLELSVVADGSAQEIPEFINYSRFLDLYTTTVDKKLAKVLARKQSVIIDKLCRKFYEKSMDLKQVFNEMDIDHDGKISYDVFFNGLRRFKKPLGLDGGQLYDLMRSVDKDKDGLVNWQDFLDRFSVKFDKISEVPEEHKQFLLDALGELANAIYRKKGSTDAAKTKRMFRLLTNDVTKTSPTSSPQANNSGSRSASPSKTSTDISPSTSERTLEMKKRRASSTSGYESSASHSTASTNFSIKTESLRYVSLNFEEFSAALRRELRVKHTDEQMRILFDYLDRNKDGSVNYFEFRRVFKFTDKESDKWAGDAIATEIQNNRNKLMKVFVEMDVEGSGKLPLDDFKTVFNSLLGKALEEEEARVLGETLSPETPELVDYNNFLKSFRATRRDD